MKSIRIIGIATIALMFTSGCLPVSPASASPQPGPNSQGTQYVRGVPQCGHSEYDNRGNFYLVNNCNIKVKITFTNQGNGLAWGTASLEAGTRQLTESMGNANARDNGSISLYTCPGDSTPVTPDGTPFPNNHYKGPYTCAVD